MVFSADTVFPQKMLSGTPRAWQFSCRLPVKEKLMPCRKHASSTQVISSSCQLTPCEISVLCLRNQMVNFVFASSDKCRMWSNTASSPKAAHTSIKVPSRNAESSFIFQKVCLWRTGAPWHTTKSSHRGNMCVPYLQWYDTYKAASKPSGVSLHISWQANSNLQCSLIYAPTLHGYSESWKCIVPLLLFDAFEYNRLCPTSSHWFSIWWHLALGH